jgi:hypothetical protein
MKLFQIMVLFLLFADLVYAQSIGATPEKTIEVDINTPTSAYFSVSQGSEYNEQITIRGEYDWLSIDERDFVLESKTGKSVKVDINAKKSGEHTAYFRICGSEISSQGEVLAVKACTNHKLTVIVNGSPGHNMIIPIVIGSMILGLYYFFKILNEDFGKNNGPFRLKKRKK